MCRAMWTRARTSTSAADGASDRTGSSALLRRSLAARIAADVLRDTATHIGSGQPAKDEDRREQTQCKCKYESHQIPAVALDR